MSRYVWSSTEKGTRDVTPVLNAAERWKDNCLVGNGSYFLKKPLWTIENLEELEHRFIQNLDERRDKTVWEKIRDQLDGTYEDAYLLMAEIIWLLYLPVVHNPPSTHAIRLETKKKNIDFVLSLARKKVDDFEPLLGESYASNIARAPQGYLSLWQSIGYTILLALDFKKENRDFDDGFSQFCDDVAASIHGRYPRLQIRNPPFRHMLVYMLFPDDRERIFSGEQRGWILDRWGQGSKGLSHCDIDDQLERIRPRVENDAEIRKNQAAWAIEFPSAADGIDWYQPWVRIEWDKKWRLKNQAEFESTQEKKLIDLEKSGRKIPGLESSTSESDGDSVSDEPGRSVGIRPSDEWNLTSPQIRDMSGLCYAYVMQFGTRNVWKIGISKDPERRQREANSFIPAEVLKENWQLRYTEAHATGSKAFDMEQAALRSADAQGFKIYGERVHCSAEALERLWIDAYHAVK